MNNLVFLDEAEAQRVCERWKKILRLQDWTVKVEITKATDISDVSALGGINFYDHDSAVWIRILRPEDVEQGVFGDDDDQECTLVHELLHIFEPLRGINEPEKHIKIGIERCVNRLSRTLLALDRQARGVPNLTFYREATTGE